MATILQVRKSQIAREDALIGPVTCYVANFASQYPSYRKFTYMGCNFVKGSGLLYGRSIEGHTECEHKPSRAGNHDNMYRFDLFLVDANNGGEPLRATIFDLGRKLLGLSPDDFQRNDADRQLHLLLSMTQGMPLVTAWFRTGPDGKAVIQKLEKVIDVSSPEEFKTPRSSMKSPMSAPSSSSRGSGSRGRGKGRFDGVDLGAVHRQLTDCMELLGTLTTRDEDYSE